MYTPNIFGYKAIHSFVYNTVVPILLSTLHSLSYTTLVQFGETFLSVLLLKFCTSSHCRAYFSSVNTLSKIWSPWLSRHLYSIMFSNSIMEICWITTLHYKALHNLTASISTNSKYIGNSYYLNLCCPANIPSSRLQSLDPSSVWSQSCNRADGLSGTRLLHTTNSLTTNKVCGHIHTI